MQLPHRRARRLPLALFTPLLVALLVSAGCGRSRIAGQAPADLATDAGVWADGLSFADYGPTPDLAPADLGPAPDLPAADQGSTELPDLAVKIEGATVKDADITYTVKVCNLGPAASTPCALDLYYDASAAPKAGQRGDTTAAVAALKSKECTTLTLSRKSSPNGSYTSWVQVDITDMVKERVETNNIAGPVKVTVSVQRRPDLIVKNLKATVNGSDIEIRAEACNIGLERAFVSRIDFYYDRTLRPSLYFVGDSDSTIFNLRANTCRNYSRTYKNPPVGRYTIWSQVDTLNTVPESNEGNNTAGPVRVTLSAPAECTALCARAIACGVFKWYELSRCQTWCNGMSTSQRSCITSAKDCTALKACKSPALPPTPVPLWGCVNVCSHLTNTCKLVPSNMNLACMGICQTLPETKKQCAWNAMNKKQCWQVFACVF